MTQEIKKLKKYQQPLGIYFLSPKRILFFLIALFIFTVFAFENINTKAFAATGINRTINFQGKVVNKDGTNVADGQYTFVFKLYDASSGGSNPWTETQNNVQVTAGIFRVSLGSVTTFASAGVDFNTDNLYLAINFNSDGEMTPRVRFAAVPYAINAETVGGLTVTNTTGTLTIPNAKTVQFGGAFTTSAQDLTLTLSGATSVTLPTSGTLATLAGAENLSNKSFTSTVTFSGITTDITTGSNENLTISPNGTGNMLLQTQAGGQAALIVDKTGLGDIFAASSSAITRFVIKSDGTASSSAGFTVDGVGSLQSTGNQTLTVGGGSTGNLVIGRASQVVTLPGFDCSGSGNGGKLTTTSGGVLTCASDGGGTSSYSPFQDSSVLGINYQVNTTEDFLIGGVATTSAKFAILGVAGVRGTQTASVSGNLVLDAAGSIQTTNNQTLTIGGNTTGNIIFSPSNNSGRIGINTSSPLAALDVRATSSIPAASLSGDLIIMPNNGAGGNVGIGTTSATAKLSLVGGNFLQTARDATFKSSITALGNNELYVFGKYAYVAVGGNGLQIIDVSNPASPTTISTYDTTGNSQGVFVSGSYAYVADGSSGLQIINISNPAVPRLSGTYNTPNDALAVYVVGKHAYVADTTSLVIVDISDASNPKLVGSYQRPSDFLSDVQVQGKYAYLTDTNNGVLRVVDVSNPSSPFLTGTQSLSSFPESIFVSGKYAYTANFSSGRLEIINIANPSSPSSVAIYLSSGSQAMDVSIAGKYAYIAQSSGGLEIVDISNPSIPVRVGAYTGATDATSVFVAGKYAYVGNGANNNVHIVDINGIDTPSLFAGVIGTDQLHVSGNANIGNDLYIGNSLNVGQGGIYSEGAFSFVGASGSGNLIQGAPTGKALLVLDQLGNQDIFAASASGVSKFVITNDGTASSSAGFTVDGIGSIQSTKNQTLTLGGGSTGNLIIGRASQVVTLPGFDCSGSGNGGKLTTTAGGVLTCAADGGGSSSYSPFQDSSAFGINYQVNTTEDFLIGGVATGSAKFAVLGVAGSSPTASVSAQNVLGQALILGSDGSIQTTRNNSMVIGGNSTGSIQFKPGNSSNSLYLGTNGNVGIGGFASTYDLEVQRTTGTTNQSLYLNADPGTSQAFASLDFNAHDTASTPWTTSYDTSETLITALGVDTVNNVLYGGSNNGGIIYRCELSTGCDSSGDWVTAYDTSVTNIESFVMDTTNNVIYMGGSNGAQIFRCETMNGCESSGDWAVAYSSTQDVIYSLVFDEVNGILYAGSFDASTNGHIYRCDVTSACDVSGDWTSVNDTSLTGDGFYSMIIDTVNDVIYAGDTISKIWRCPISSSCDVAGDWASMSVGSSTVYSFDIDTTHSVIYASTSNSGIILRCELSTSCDLAGEWTTSYDSAASTMYSITFDPVGGVLFAGGDSSGIIYRCPVSSDCNAGGDWSTEYDSASTSIRTSVYDPTSGVVYAGSGSDGVIYRHLETFTGSKTLYAQIQSLASATGDGSEIGSLLFNTAINGSTTESLRLYNGFVGIGTSSPISALNVTRALTLGATGKALAIFNQTENQDILTASASGVTKFVIKNDGTASSSAGFTVDGVGSIQSTKNQTLTIGGGSTGNLIIGRASQVVTLPGFDCSASGNGGKLTTTSGGVLTCAADGGGSSSYSPFQDSSAFGINYQVNTTEDFLIGGVATTSAKFAVLGIAGTTVPTASVSAQNALGQALYIKGDGSMQTVRNNTLTIGGDTTGKIILSPSNSGTGSMIVPGADNLVSLGSSSSARFKDVFLGPSSLHIQCTVANGCGQALDYALGVNTSTNALYIGVNGRAGTLNQLITLTEGGNVGIGTTSPNGTLHVSGGINGGNAAMVVNQSGISSNDIFAASSSGVTKFIITNNGTASSSAGFTVDGVGSIQSTKNQTLTIGGGSTGNLIIGRASQTVTLPGFDCSGSGGGGKLTTTSGGVLTCSADGGGSGSNWVLSSVNGTLNPINNTLDLLMGATSTASAKFAVLGIAGTTVPTASISAQNVLGQAIVIGGDGSIQTVRNNSLTIGGSSTGNIIFSPANNNGRGTVGIGTTPAGGWMGNLYISGDYGGKALTILDSTSSTQDILTASSSGTARFSITNSGGIKLGVNEGGLGQCLMSNGAGLGASWAGCAAGGVGWWNLVSSQGTLIPVNTTLDMLWGGISSASARFHLFGSTNSGTTPVASISANSSFAGLVIDQTGTGDFLTASASGVTKFTITKSGGIIASDGLTINKTGSNDIVKTTSGNNTIDTDFQRTANATSATITNLDNTGGELSLSKGTVSSNGTITTGSQPTTPAALGAGASSITNSTGRYMVIRGGASTTLYLYNSLSNSFQTATSVTSANVGAGSVTIPRPDGKYLVVHGGGVATTSVIDPNDNVPGVAGPTATGNNGAGTNIYRRQNGQYLLLHGAAAGTTRIYNPVANTFAAGPTAGGTTWGAGSLVLPRQNGTALIVAGGATANTQLYNLDGAAGIGSFTAGPVLPTNCEINNAGSVALQLANGRYIILSKAGVSVEYDPVNNTMGTCQNVGPTAALADGAHAIRLQDRRFLIYRGSGTTDAYIYNPATNTYSTHATSTSTQGAGLHSLQRHDGTWMTFVGGSTTTNKYDSQLVMSGSYTSEDINTNSLNPSSSLWFTAGAEALFVGTTSATTVADLPQSGLEISVQTASTQGGLSSATERRIYRNGEPIRAGVSDKWIRITVDFTRPIPQQIYDERKTWVGNGMTNIIKDYQDPTLYDYMIDNSTVFARNNFDFVDSQSSQDPTEASASAFTRVQPMADRITLPWGKVPGPTQISTNGGMYLGSIGVHPPLLAPTADGTLVIQRPGGLISIIASGSANMNLYDPASSQFTAQSGAGNIPTASTGRGAFALKLPNGKFFIVLGNGTSTTNIYDPNGASGSQFVAGPTLSGVAGFGAQPILNKDGTYTILHGGGLTTSTLFNPYTDPIKPSSVTLPVGPVTTIAINCGSWAIPLSGQLQDTYRVSPGVAPFIAGLTTSMTYDSVAKVFTAGPTQTGAHGCGSYAFQRQDGYWVSVAGAGGTTGAQSTATQLINPWSNTNIAGATLTNAVGRGSVVIPRADGTFLITRGQTQTMHGNGSNIYIPWGGTFGVGAGIGTSVAGPNLIDYAATPGTAVQGTGSVTFQRPDGKWVIIAGGQVTGSAIVNLYDAGWYPDGQYQSGQIYAPTLTTSSTMSWKKSPDDFVDFEVRTSPTREALLTASYDSVSRSGDTVSADSGDKWVQVQINFSRRFLGYDGIYRDSWPSTGAYPALVVSQPTVFEYRINNAYDFLTLKNDGLNVFRVNKYGAVYSGVQGGFYTGGADLAENYSSKEILAKGEVVGIDGKAGDHNIKKSTGQYQPNMLGVVSTNPGFVAGDGTEDAYPVALVGRVPVKVSTENGPIREGDALTSASIPGYAMKATVGGRVLGRALQSFDESTSETCPALGMGNLESTKCGTLMLFVNLVDFSGESVNVAMKESGFTLDEKELPAVAGIDFSEGTTAYRQQEVLGFLKTQKDNGQGIYTDRVAATQEIISPQIVTDLLIAKKIKAESIEGLEIITNSIETLSNRISTGSAVTNFSDRLTLLAQNQDQFQAQMASIAAKLEKMDNLNLLTMANISSGEGQLTTVANLAVFNTATFAQASVLDNLQVGNNMTLSMNAINTIGADLEIQSLKQGAISFLGGLIRFDTDGKVTFAEDVYFQKNVAVTGVLSAHTVASTELQLAQGTTTVLSDTEVDSTAAAGLVTLKRGTDHMKINNPLVKETSFIFITPKTKTNHNLFLLDQREAKDEEKGSFTVGVDAKATDDIKFNYLIVN